MEILFESIKSTQISYGDFIFSLLIIIVMIGLGLTIKDNNLMKTKEKYIFATACFIVALFGLTSSIDRRINYETIHTKKIIFTEQQNFKISDEITIYPELSGYKVTEIEGKIYTVELVEKK